MNLITQRLHRIYLVVALLLVIPDTFNCYSLNVYSNIQTAFIAIPSSTVLTWLIVSYLALFFAIFTQNLEMRAFLTLTALVTHIFNLDKRYLALKWGFICSLLKMYLLEPNLLLILKLSPHSVNSTSSFINHPKKRVANPLTALVSFLKSPSTQPIKQFSTQLAGLVILPKMLNQI